MKTAQATILALILMPLSALALTSLSAVSTVHSTTPPSPTLAPREMVVDQAGQTLPATQYPTVTTGWFETTLLDGVHTWIPITFTQTFASTPLEPGPTIVGSGSIGLCKVDCDIVPKQTGMSASGANKRLGGSEEWRRVRTVLAYLAVVGLVMSLA